MHNRRKFLKSFLAGGVAVGMGAKTDIKANVLSGSLENDELPNGFAMKTTIFCQIADPQLASSLNWPAKNLSCDLYNGKPITADIFATPYFIAIVDRNIVGKELWTEYLEFRKEVDDTTPFILVDYLGDSDGWEIDEHMEICDIGNRDQVRYIVERIKETHLVAQE